MAYTTINKSTEHFRTKLYTGNGSNDRAITFDESTNMQPDWLWIKSRGTGQSHAIFDAVRGANKRLVTNSSGAETTENANLDSFDTNGFTIDNEAIVNENGIGYASWNWKANGAGSANTDGTTTSTVSVNTTAGFSIGTYTGTSAVATIGHGLGTVPAMIMVKNLSSGSRQWAVYHKNLSGTNKYLRLNTTDAEQTDSSTWNNTTPTNAVFASSGSGEVNQSGENFVFYAFAEKIGYSKFGSYTGNGNADGPFIYTGFKPAFVFQKRTDSTSNWHIFDNKREPENVMDKYLAPNDSGAEGTATGFDFLSNGFKSRTSSNWNNQSGGTYIYMAFGQSLVGSNNVPCTAR